MWRTQHVAYAVTELPTATFTYLLGYATVTTRHTTVYFRLITQKFYVFHARGLSQMAKTLRPFGMKVTTGLHIYRVGQQGGPKNEATLFSRISSNRPTFLPAR